MSAKPKTTETPKWPGAKLWSLDKIKPYPKNARTHPDEQIGLLADLIGRFGPDQPIVVDEDGVILKGHGRLAAAHRAGLTYFPVVQHIGLSGDDKKAMRIADNKVALLSDWDRGLLGGELRELKLANYEMPLLGFSEIELRPFMESVEPPKNPNAPTQIPEKLVVRAGDIWEMGEHRIICGDSTDLKTWERLMRAQKAALVFTDPPYGVSYEAPSGEFEVIQGDKKRRDELYDMLVKAFGCMAAVTSYKAAFYIWHASSTRNDFAQAMTAAGLVEKQYLIWAKPSIALGWDDYNWGHEPCFYACHDGEAPEFYGDRANSTVWRIEAVRTDRAATVIGSGLMVLSGDGRMLFVQPKAPKSKKLREIRLTKAQPSLILADDTGTGTVWEVTRDSDYVHPTQKPVALAIKAIENSSRPGEIVVDGFSGSGTTLIGCEMTGRRARVVELDPQYVQAAIERWEKFTGRKATLADDGRTLEDVAKARRGQGRQKPREGAQGGNRTRGGDNAKGGTRKPVRGGKGAARADRPMAE